MDTSVYKQLYYDISDRIKNNISAIRHIDIDFNQDEDEQPLLSYPAALIDFPEADHSQLSNRDICSDIIISIKIVFKQISNTSSVTPLVYKDKAFEFFEIEKQLQDLMHGWAPQYCSPFIVKKTEGENKENKIRTRKLMFTTSV